MEWYAVWGMGYYGTVWGMVWYGMGYGVWGVGSMNSKEFKVLIILIMGRSTGKWTKDLTDFPMLPIR